MSGIAGVTITRDDKFVPTVRAPTIEKAYEAIGYLHASDRPWQTFTSILTGNAKLASAVGPAGLSADLIVVNLLYDDATVLSQYMMWDPQVKAAFDAYLVGLNKRYQEYIDNPSTLPFQFVATSTTPRTFTTVEGVNFIYFLIRNFSSSTSPVLLDSQFTNFTYLTQLVGTFGPAAGFALFNDIAGVNNVTAARWSLTDGDSLGRIGERSLDASTFGGGMSGTITCDVVQGVLKQMEEFDETLHKFNINLKCGSRSGFFGPEKTAKNGIVAFGGAQSGQDAPSPQYYAIVKTPDYEFDGMSLPGSFAAPLMTNVRNGCYCYTMATQTGTFHARDISFEPRSNLFVYRTVTIEVKGAPDQTVEVLRSNSSGIVITQAQPGLYVVERTKFLNDDIRGLDIFGRLQFLRSFNDFKSLPTTGNQTDLPSSVVTFGDNGGNIGAIHLGVRTEVPIVNRKLPQLAPALMGPPQQIIVPISDYEVFPPAIVYNQEPYYAYWNGAWSPLQGTNVYNTYEYQRVWWIYHVADKFGQLKYEDMKRYLALLGDSRVLTSGLAMTVEGGTPAQLNNSTDAFLLVRDRFREAMQGTGAGPAQALLSRYDGRWIGGDVSNIVNSLDVLDDWMLANTWLAEVQRSIFGSLFPFTFSSSPVPWAGSVPLLSLTIRVLSNPVNNPIFFTGYPSQAQIETIIRDAFNTAINTLYNQFGSQPWGTALRRMFTFTNDFLGPVASIPYLQHGTHESVTEIQKDGIVARSHAIAPGVTETILAPGVPASSFTSLLSAFENFDLEQYGSRKTPESCRRKPKCFV